MSDQIDSSIIVQTLKESWFEGGDDKEIQKIVEKSRIKRVPKNESVYMVGDTMDTIFCILEGQVMVSIIEKNGEEFALTLWEEGSWFGETAFVPKAMMPLEARAKSDVVLLAVPVDQIDKMADAGALFYKNILIDLIKRIRLLYWLVEVLIFKPLPNRVAARVMHLAEFFGRQTEDGIELPTKFSQSDFARMSGGSRQRVNAIFRDFTDRGIVAKMNNRYVVLDLPALRAEFDKDYNEKDFQ